MKEYTFIKDPSLKEGFIKVNKMALEGWVLINILPKGRSWNFILDRKLAK
jgi:hypothetical protein